MMRRKEWGKEVRTEEEDGQVRGWGGFHLHWYEYDAEAAARATSLLIPPYQPRARMRKEGGDHCIHDNGRAAVGSSLWECWGTAVLLSFPFSLKARPASAFHSCVKHSVCWNYGLCEFYLRKLDFFIFKSRMAGLWLWGETYQRSVEGLAELQNGEKGLVHGLCCLCICHDFNECYLTKMRSEFSQRFI